jgi:hypothetical protein
LRKSRWRGAADTGKPGRFSGEAEKIQPDCEQKSAFPVAPTGVCRIMWMQRQALTTARGAPGGNLVRAASTKKRFFMEFVPTLVFRTAGTIMLVAWAAGATGTATFAASAGATAGPVLVPHRAVYDMSLDDMEEQAGIAGLKGRMVYDFSGSACEGYSVNFRFVTEFQDKDGGSQITDLQTTSFEEPHGASYQFLSKTFADQELVESTRGTARVGAKGKTVELKEPEEKSFTIGKDVLFPTEHLLSIIKAAEDGVHFVAADIYDGAETGDKVYATTTVIGAEAAYEPGSKAKGAKASLAGQSYWPVTVAYFDPGADDASGELLPVYQLTFHLFGNGVSTDLKLDYGDFIIRGTMSSLELHEETPCPQN